MVLFIFLNLILCIENLRLSPTGFREQQTLIISLKLNLTKLCVCVCATEKQWHTLSVSHCALSWCRHAWLVSPSLSLSLSTGWLGPLSAALKALMSSWGEISTCIISKTHCLHKNHVAYIFPILFFFCFYLTFFFIFFFYIVLKVFHTMKGIFSPCDSWLYLMTVFIIPSLF